MIQIPIQAIVHRSEQEEIRASAFTVGVNTHGCLLVMDVKPSEGQRTRLLSARSVTEKSGRVLYTQRTREGSFAVARNVPLF
jgi:hypothetical protein